MLEVHYVATVNFVGSQTVVCVIIHGGIRFVTFPHFNSLSVHIKRTSNMAAWFRAPFNTCTCIQLNKPKQLSIQYIKGYPDSVSPYDTRPGNVVGLLAPKRTTMVI